MKKFILIIFFISLSVFNYGQKHELRFQAGAGLNSLVTKATTSNEGSYHYYYGIALRRQILKNISGEIGLQLNYRKQNTFTCRYYDKMYKEEIFFECDFSQKEFSFPLAVSYSIKKFEIDLLCNFKYLYSSNLNMKPVGFYTTLEDDINAKYSTKDNTTRSQFTPFNYAIGFRVGFNLVKNLAIQYRFTYDLEVNPRYSYITKYNTIYNSIGLSYGILLKKRKI